MQGKRTGINFSKHIVEVKQSEGLLVHYIRRPNTITQSVKFINTNGIMAVTGDFGNWIFCREFHPDGNTGVSGDYWHEKLRMSSCQVAEDFDSEGTIEHLRRGIDGGLEEYGYRGDQLKQAIDYYEECLDYADLSEHEYTSFAFREMPGFFDAEQVPFVKKLKERLRIVFDAFDEICRRMKESEVANG